MELLRKYYVRYPGKNCTAWLVFCVITIQAEYLLAEAEEDGLSFRILKAKEEIALLFSDQVDFLFDYQFVIDVLYPAHRGGDFFGNSFVFLIGNCTFQPVDAHITTFGQ